jgi:outer membrane phospholipase A
MEDTNNQERENDTGEITVDKCGNYHNQLCMLRFKQLYITLSKELNHYEKTLANYDSKLATVICFQCVASCEQRKKQESEIQVFLQKYICKHIMLESSYFVIIPIDIDTRILQNIVGNRHRRH